jgi:hypothetical protein
MSESVEREAPDVEATPARPARSRLGDLTGFNVPTCVDHQPILTVALVCILAAARRRSRAWPEAV